VKLAFYGSSLLSSLWNGAATYYRGLLQALAARGHEIVFYEPDAFGRQARRDFDPSGWAHVVVYPASESGVAYAVHSAASADIVVKASGVGVFDEQLLAVWAQARPEALRFFLDVDAPATLRGLQRGSDGALRRALPRLDAVLTYGGGRPVIDAYRALGARRCVPIYNAHDPSTHHPAPPEPRFACDLAFLGNRLPDREARFARFFLDAARRLPNARFLLGGSGWDGAALPANVCTIGHVPAGDHNAFNTSARAVLNITREDMAETGYAPATRLLEAAAAGACIITDAWQGIDAFFEPEREILIAQSGAEVAAILAALTPDKALEIGGAARRRALADHVYDQRAATFDAVITAAQDARLSPAGG